MEKMTKLDEEMNNYIIYLLHKRLLFGLNLSCRNIAI